MTSSAKIKSFHKSFPQFETFLREHFLITLTQLGSSLPLSGHTWLDRGPHLQLSNPLSLDCPTSSKCVGRGGGRFYFFGGRGLILKFLLLRPVCRCLRSIISFLIISLNIILLSTSLCMRPLVYPNNTKCCQPQLCSCSISVRRFGEGFTDNICIFGAATFYKQMSL